MPPIHLSCSTHIHFLQHLLQQVNEEIDHQLHQARVENDKLSNLMGEMGISPRPTVAQWLQQKREQKKASMQEALISWDRWATVSSIVVRCGGAFAYETWLAITV